MKALSSVLAWITLSWAIHVAGADVGPPSLTSPQPAGSALAGPVSGAAAISSFKTAVTLKSIAQTVFALTDATTVAWDMSNGADGSLTIGGNRTLGAPTNIPVGGSGVLAVTQDGTGGWTLAYNAVWKVPQGIPIISPSIGAITILNWYSPNGTNLYLWPSSQAVDTSSTQTIGGSKTLSAATLTTPVINGQPSGTGVSAVSTASTLTLRDTSASVSGVNFLNDYTTTATAAGTTTLLVGSTYLQFFTGSTTQTVTMPVTSTLTLGQQYAIINTSSGVVTVQSSGANTIQALASNSYLQLTCVLTSGTTAASWTASYSPPSATIAAPNTLALRDANANIASNNWLDGYATTTTAAGTTVLTVSSAYAQYFTGTTTQAVTLPVTSTLVLGQKFLIVNNSSGVVTVQSSGANPIQAMASSTSAICTCILTSGTTGASWSTQYASASGGSAGTVNPGTLNQIAYYASSTNSVSPNTTTSLTPGGALSLTPSGRTSGVSNYFALTIPTDTGITASAESIGYNHVTGTRTWATTGTVALQRENFFAGPTYGSASASQTFTDAFTLYATPPIPGTNAIFTRGHTLGIVDSTSAASSITGGLVVATTLGTAATSVGIGGGNVNAGGLITGGTVTSTGALTAGATSITGATGTTALTVAQTARTSGVLPYIKYTIPTDTSMTASTEAPGIVGASATRTWATTGTVALQREIFFPGPTYASASANQTLTDVFNMYLSPPLAGANMVFTRGHTFGVIGDGTSAASPITGAVVVSTTLGTTATSVGIGGGNIYAGSNITAQGTITATTLSGSVAAANITTPPATAANYAAAFPNPLNFKTKSTNGSPLTSSDANAYYRVTAAGGTTTVTNLSLTSNVVTITCTNTFTTSESITIALTSGPALFADCNGTFAIASASGSQITYNLTHANITSGAAAGSAIGTTSVTLPSASSVGSGFQLWIENNNTAAYVQIVTNATIPDTVSGNNVSTIFNGIILSQKYAKMGLVSDGVSDWTVIACNGDEVESIVSAVTGAATTVNQNLTSVVFSPGEWDISSGISATGTGTFSLVYLSMGSTSATLTANYGYDILTTSTVAANISLTLPPIRKVFSVPTTFYCVTQCTYAVGTSMIYGSIHGRRIR